MPTRPTLRRLAQANASGIHAYAESFLAEVADYMRAAPDEREFLQADRFTEAIAMSRNEKGALAMEVSDSDSNGQAVQDRDRVVVANIIGNMYYEDAAELADDMMRMAADPRTRGIVLNLDTPGGEAIAGDVIVEAIETIRQERGIPIKALANGMAASAGAMVAVAADEFFLAHDRAVTGSVGTMMSWIDIKGFFRSMGLDIRDIYATKSTRKNEVSRALEAGNDDPARQQILDPVNEEFIDFVARRKPRTPREGYEDGRLLVGNQAIEIEFANGKATLESLIDNILSQSPGQASTIPNPTNTDMEMETVELAGQPVQLTSEQAAELREAQQQAAAKDAADNAKVEAQQEVEQLNDKLQEASQLFPNADAEDFDLVQAIKVLQQEHNTLRAMDGASRAQLGHDQRAASERPAMFQSDLDKVARIANRIKKI